jgi:hypothetical protein
MLLLRIAVLAAAGAALVLAGAARAQQVSDPDFNPPISRPAYEPQKGPLVAIDEAHHNFHTADGRYQPFAELLRRDGYRVEGFGKPFSPESLKGVDILVISNALSERNEDDWSLPTPSAFTPDEIAAVRAWVGNGGSLLLIADHMPFAGAATDLARAFGFEFSNGYARAGNRVEGRIADIFDSANGLKESPATHGRADEERVTKAATFTGSAFKPPIDAMPILVFGANAVSLETKEAPGITPDAPEVPIDGWCQGAIVKVGAGRAAVFGEAAMFSAQLGGPNKIPVGMNSPDAGQNHQLLLNVMHWLSRVEGMSE